MRTIEKIRLKIIIAITFFVSLGFFLANYLSPLLGVPIAALAVIIGYIFLIIRVVCSTCGTSLIMNGLVARLKTPEKCPYCGSHIK